MPDAFLVLNAGSSSLKFATFRDADPPQPLVRGQIEGLKTHPHFTAHAGTTLAGEREWEPGARVSHEDATAFLLEWIQREALSGHRLAAVGHRVVHGGTQFAGPTRIDAATLSALDALVPLAPLHQSQSIAGIKAVARMAPALPQVACFDTAFHRTQPATAQAVALPRRYTDEGVHRYGFHGLSYEYIASVLATEDPVTADRTIVAHLGNGASLCAMKNGQSVATTMGFSTLDGLVMGTRCGALDPGVVLYLMDRHGMTHDAVQRVLYEESGLLGVSGVSSDMQALLASAEPHAAEAINLFVYRIAREIGSLAAALGGLDRLVFTGGIGEHAASIRARVCHDAGWLGLELDETANAGTGRRISRSGSRVTAWVIPTDEELMMARHTRRVLSS